MIGRTLSHYEVMDKLGAGGMGVVYRARDTTLNRDVAIHELEESDGVHFLVMELVPGETLAERIQHDCGCPKARAGLATSTHCHASVYPASAAALSSKRSESAHA